MDEDELFVYAKNIHAPFSLVQEVAKTGRLPVVNFAAGGIATPADAALMMQLGVDGETATDDVPSRGTRTRRGGRTERGSPVAGTRRRRRKRFENPFSSTICKTCTVILSLKRGTRLRPWSTMPPLASLYCFVL